MAKEKKQTPEAEVFEIDNIIQEEPELIETIEPLTFAISPLNLIQEGGSDNMYNAVNEAAQTVLLNNNVLFSTDRVRSNRANACCGGWLSHDLGSGLFTLVNNNKCGCATFRIDFNANITSATTGAIAFAIKSNGEQIAGTEMDYTPAAANVYESVSASTVITVPFGASKTISIGNVLGATNLVKNANIIITKIN